MSATKQKILEAENMGFSARPAEFDQKAVADMGAMLDLFRDEPTNEYVPPIIEQASENFIPPELASYNNVPVSNNYSKQVLMEKPIPAGAKFDPMTGKPLQLQWKFDPITGKPINESIEEKPIIKESNGKWILTRKNHKDGSSTYSVKHNIVKNYIIENMECKEAAWCVMKLLNEGKTINQYPIDNILEEERRIKKTQSEMDFMENRINIMRKKGQSPTLLESKYSNKEDQYQSAYNQIKKYKEEITRLK